MNQKDVSNGSDKCNKNLRIKILHVKVRKKKRMKLRAKSKKKINLAWTDGGIGIY